MSVDAHPGWPLRMRTRDLPASITQRFVAPFTWAYDHGDYETARKTWRELAELNDGKAEYSLGVIYAHGHGVEEDSVEAVKWVRRAAEHGVVKAQYALGLLYKSGADSVQADRVAAYMWFDIAARNGFDRGARRRDALSVHMTPEQIDEAETRTHTWLEAHAR